MSEMNDGVYPEDCNRELVYEEMNEWAKKASWYGHGLWPDPIIWHENTVYDNLKEAERAMWKYDAEYTANPRTCGYNLAAVKYRGQDGKIYWYVKVQCS